MVFSSSGGTLSCEGVPTKQTDTDQIPMSMWFWTWHAELDLLSLNLVRQQVCHAAKLSAICGAIPIEVLNLSLRKETTCCFKASPAPTSYIHTWSNRASLSAVTLASMICNSQQAIEIHRN
eukprot:4987287-Amphidinium_carterae.1